MYYLTQTSLVASGLSLSFSVPHFPYLQIRDNSCKFLIVNDYSVLFFTHAMFDLTLKLRKDILQADEVVLRKS